MANATLWVGEFAPVVVFVYKRPTHTARMLSALRACALADRTPVYVFSDGPKTAGEIASVAEVRSCFVNHSGFESIRITERKVNFGLSRSVVEGVSEIIQRYGRVIVLEDDILVAREFLSFMNEALNAYRQCSLVGSVSGFRPGYSIPADVHSDAVLTNRHSSWGWGTFLDVWNSIDWVVADYNEFRTDKSRQKSLEQAGNDMSLMLDLQMAGRIDSWSIRFDYSCARQGLYAVAPRRNLLINVGFDGSGEHCGISDKFAQEMAEEVKLAQFRLGADIGLDPRITAAEWNFFKISPIKRIFLKLSVIFSMATLRGLRERIRRSLSAP